MKTYETIEEWRNDWTPEKETEYKKVFNEKYGDVSPMEHAMLLVSDRDLTEITGKVKFKVDISRDGDPKLPIPLYVLRGAGGYAHFKDRTCYFNGMEKLVWEEDD